MGGREVAELIERAWRGGARFDGWSESFDAGVWRRAAAETGLELGGPGWATAEELPWRGVDPLVHDAWLRAEAASARRGETSDDCRVGACTSCGVCGGEVEMDLVARGAPR
jgi:hypothetical protein